MKACAFNVLIVTKQVALPCLPEMQLPRLCWQGSARSDEGLAVPCKAGVSRGRRWNEVTCVTRSRFWSATDSVAETLQPRQCLKSLEWHHAVDAQVAVMSVVKCHVCCEMMIVGVMSSVTRLVSLT